MRHVIDTIAGLSVCLQLFYEIWVLLNYMTFFCFILVVYKGYLYVFGGYNGKFDYHFRDVLRFDPGKSKLYSDKLFYTPFNYCLLFFQNISYPFSSPGPQGHVN